MKKMMINILSVLLILGNITGYVSASDGEFKSNEYLSEAVVTKGEEGAFTIQSNVIGNSNLIKEVQYKVWTKYNGEDDLEEGILPIVQNKIELIVEASNHNNEEGIYEIEINVMDLYGNVNPLEIEKQEIIFNDEKKETVEIEKQKDEKFNQEKSEENADKVALLKKDNSLQFNDVKVTKTSSASYLVSVKMNSLNNLAYVQFPTWTNKNGQEDITWGKGTISGDTVIYTVDIKDHKFEVGNYSTHIYAYDKSGKLSTYILPDQSLTNDAPKISDVKVVPSSGRLTITAKITDDYGLEKVQFPTWTSKNGQDDIVWGEGSISGDTVTCEVEFKDHNFESGNYSIHIYAYDKAGKLTTYVVPTQTVREEAPKITDVKTVLSGGKLTITSKITSTYGLAKVQFPTWTSKNGQDDLTWGTGSINGDIVTYTVDIKDHNFETGNYSTHIYAYDKIGKLSTYVVPTQSIANDAPKITDVKTTVSEGKYIITARIMDDYGLEKVQFPTWTSRNGQDDITWGTGSINGDIVTYTVDFKDHDFETGQYTTHIYAYDKAGKSSAYVVPTQNITNEAPKITDVKTTSTGGKIIITAKITDDYGLEKVQFPTWSSKNGQDDMIWGIGIKSGDVITYTVDFKNHNYETGSYSIHIYAYDRAGKLSTYVVPTQNIKNDKPNISNITVSDVLAGSYVLECSVDDDYEMDYVKFATWTSKNGQDDIVWKEAPVKNGKARVVVNSSDHYYEAGEYVTHIYAFDKAGAFSVAQNVQNMRATELTPGWRIINGKKYLFNNKGAVVEGANKLIIDISSHNGNIDWQAVKNSGVDGVILRVGYGWNENLEAQRDSKFNQNADELERLGIPYGVYLFSYESSAWGASKEAQYTLDLIKGRHLSYPVYYDLEYDDFMGDISPEMYTTMAHAYCQKIEAAGYAAGIYANLNYWNTKFYDSSLDRYTKWVAQYNTNDGLAGHCDYQKPYEMWQYTSVGKIPGISTNVDMNAFGRLK